MSRVASAGGTAADETVDANRPKRRKLTGWKAFLRDVAVILIAAIVISFLIKTFLIRSFYIPSDSMNDTLLQNDRIIVNELEPRVFPLSHGDIVVFKDPGGWLQENAVPKSDPGPVASFFDGLLSIVGLTSPDSDHHLVKRVIGLPGDKVACCNSLGQMTINGVPITEPYAKLQPGSNLVSKDPFSVTVPKDSLWVMGDNRYNSLDSRYHQDDPGHGFVPYRDVVGRAVVISWPVSRWTWLDDYPFVFAEVDKKSSG